ncbi:hypothetical protein [Dictyobacter formicarum]|uniref:Uncharacterized protein n=1 Tax=Dictyobacter formicarum TaxID=2778368 RepID=A0ABQ3VB84_9CHLR|nr:hypothetical protein [Dictyobacter formicarum]GHO82471.1 hypothetical protein KSZ_04770 [Dictyobacter formicarum]
MTRPSDDAYAHLRTHAAVQRQATVDRLRQAITQLEADGRPVNTFTIKEVSGLDYMSYYRNREAFSLFQEHSTHLRKEREQKWAKQQAASRGRPRKTRQSQATSSRVKVLPRDPLLDYKRSRLVELLHEARAERDEAKRQARVAQVEAEQQVQGERTTYEQHYNTLLQEHMLCGVTIARLKAELAEFQVFMERFRSALRKEEYDH